MQSVDNLTFFGVVIHIFTCACGSPLHRLGPVPGRYVREGDDVVLRAVPKGAGL